MAAADGDAGFGDAGFVVLDVAPFEVAAAEVAALELTGLEAAAFEEAVCAAVGLEVAALPLVPEDTLEVEAGFPAGTGGADFFAGAGAGIISR